MSVLLKSKPVSRGGAPAGPALSQNKRRIALLYEVPGPVLQSEKAKSSLSVSVPKQPTVMESLTNTSDKKAKLLTIPRAELDSATVSSAPLQLLQLPPSWTVNDLANAKFVAKPSQQAVLVTNNKSFAVHRVETSNALIMVPPAAAIDSNKKQKVSGGSALPMVPARLLKTGGSGASFLELRQKKLPAFDLLAALSVWDPYSVNPYSKSKPNGPKGRTVSDLAVQLQASEAEIRFCLRSHHAYAVPHTSPVEYCLLAEEAVQECNGAIVAALAETGADYAVTGVDPDAFVVQVVARCEAFTDVEFVVRHCLTRLGQTGSNATVQLRVSKVAVCVVRRLFQKQTAPWNDEDLFLQWQSELPGVGKQYQVARDMLRGVAVKCDSELWHYMPTEKLPSSDPAASFAVLFGSKERWLLHELEPYLVRMEDSGVSQGELLLRYTKLETEDRDGISVKLYLQK